MSISDVKISIKIWVPVALGFVGFIAVSILSLSMLYDVMIEDRKDKVRNITEVAISVLKDFHQRQESGEFNEETARMLAFDSIRSMRYDEVEYVFVYTLDGVVQVLPNMRFVPIKTEEQQSALMLHKARELLVRQQNMMINALRAHMAELGLVAPQGRSRVKDIIAVIMDKDDESIPELAKAALKPLVAQLQANEQATSTLEKEIMVWHRNNEASRRLTTIPGIGYLTASAIAATVPDPSFFSFGS